MDYSYGIVALLKKSILLVKKVVRIIGGMKFKSVGTGKILSIYPYRL